MRRQHRVGSDKTPREPSSSSTKVKRDDSIMATNGSSIVSKRSVERLYYDEPHFFRYFVKKPQRRSPLINRGYWLRMHAVEVVIRKFLEESTQKRKVVLNLGCGYDPLPFQWLSKERELCREALFIDVDYPALMSKKCEVLSATSQLSNLIQPLGKPSPSDAVYLRSPHYLALGCDLTDIHALSGLVEREIDKASCMVLCVAEVSITYMDTAAADSLISWASRIGDVRFCLLEQYLPRGEDYPFAQKMVQHFENLQTPLKSIKRYPQLLDQERRFTDAGWSSAVARNLWDIWTDWTFVSTEQRLALNNVEPFDEWEEFALFASHYFLLEASSDLRSKTSGPDRCLSMPDEWKPIVTPMSLRPGHCGKSANHRRYGSLFEIEPGIIGCHGGLGDQSRLSNTTVYTCYSESSQEQSSPPLELECRMCHTITNLGARRSLLVGGRASPDRGMSDCWLRANHTWQRIEDLPIPLYRHNSSAVTRDQKEDSVLIFGGKTNGGCTSDAWFLWHELTGWVQLEVSCVAPGPRFGAAMSVTGVNNGVLFGGMASDGTIYQDFWRWEILDVQTHPRIVANDITPLEESNSNGLSLLCRVGACLTTFSMGLLVIGGVTSRQLLPNKADILCLNTLSRDDQSSDMFDYELIAVDYRSCDRPPLLIGHGVYTTNDRTIIAGGGAVCFSFGTFWNHDCWTLTLPCDVKENVWTSEVRLKSQPMAHDRDNDQSPQQVQGSDAKLTAAQNTIRSVSCITINSPRDFERVINHGQPVIMKDLDLGSCTHEWSTAYLKTRLEADRPVVVHEATEPHMNFQTKNFKYSTKPFGAFIDQITAGSLQYLRSLALDRPSEEPANLAHDFPELASDFRLPPSLEIVTQNAHSSPLRISGPVTMWLHYDVMANVLCQINGSKRLRLFPPSDISHFQIPPGESSSSINVFASDLVDSPHCHEALLEPGDVLYLPPLWLHAASPLGSTSISVNVFFRDLKSGYAPGKDVYGNRDIQAYEKGRRDVAKIAKSFSEVPGAMRRFYLERLADELKAQALAAAP